jgi:hypothetical protein
MGSTMPRAPARRHPLSATALGGGVRRLRDDRRADGLFLLLQIFTVFYALYISLWRWNVRADRSSSGG